MAMEKEKDIELKSPEMQEIMTRPPAWLNRWGIVVILVLLAAGLLLSRYIRYPDLVVAPFSFVSKTGIPTESSFHALVLIPLTGPNKVKVGQEVILKPDQFPFPEFGVLMGRVEGMSYEAMTNTYQVTVTLSADLVTNTGRKITPLNGMRGRAEIKVSDRSLYERLIQSMTPARKND
jgi:hypothetical protein